MIFETSQNSFSCRPPFGPFRSVKYLSFGQKLPIWATHHTFLESRYPENTKNPYCVFSPEGSQKKVSTHGLCQSKRKFDSKTDLNMQNSMMMFTFSVFDRKYLFEKIWSKNHKNQNCHFKLKFRTSLIMQNYVEIIWRSFFLF